MYEEVKVEGRERGYKRCRGGWRTTGQVELGRGMVDTGECCWGSFG